jgi:epoxyqueuosine reductase
VSHGAAVALATARSAAELARLAKAHAYAIGFDLVGIAALGPAETSREFEAWLADGRAGAMHYLERGAEKRRDTRLPLPGTTHAIVVGLDYGGREPSGPVARYARGDDYHDVMDAMLRELHRRVARDAPMQLTQHRVHNVVVVVAARVAGHRPRRFASTVVERDDDGVRRPG